MSKPSTHYLPEAATSATTTEASGALSESEEDSEDADSDFCPSDGSDDCRDEYESNPDTTDDDEGSSFSQGQFLQNL